MDKELEKAIRRVIREEVVQVVVGDDYMMTREQAAKYLNLTKNTLQTYAKEGIGPAYMEGQGTNGKVLYRFGDLKKYVQGRTVNTKFSIKGGTTK